MNSALERIKERQQLSVDYASYSQSRGGLSKVVGGIVGIVVILTGTLLGGGAATALITIAGTGLWLLGKEWIRARLYQPFGEAQETWPQHKRREQRYLELFLAGLSIVVMIAYALNGGLAEIRLWPYLFFVGLLAPVTWHFFRTPAEASVGIFLIAACAVHSVGGAYSLLYQPRMGQPILDTGLMVATWIPFIFAVVLIWQGMVEHRDFQRIAQKLGA